MYADLLTSEKTAYNVLLQYVSGSNALLDTDHVDRKLRAVIAEFKAWFRFHSPASCHPLDNFAHDIMRAREERWHAATWLFRVGREDAALEEVADIVGEN